MSEFDISSYLNKILADKQTEETNSDSLISDYTKARDLLDATSRKTFLLQEQSQLKREALAKENESSLITKLGLDYDSAAGTVAGVVASGVSGIARTASYGLTAAPRAYTALSEATGAMTPEYANRVRQGIESFDEMFTRAPKSLADTRSTEAFKESYFSDPTANEALGRIANTNLSNVGLGTVKDLGTLVANAIKTVPNEPIGFLNLLAENSPQIALAIATQGGSAVANAGYALSYYDKWSTGFEKQYNRPPTEAEKAEASAKASALFLSEFIGDASIGAISKAAPKGLISNISTEAFKDTLLGNTGKVLTKATATVARPVGEFAKAAIPEAITEGLQTKLEGDLEFKPATKEDIYFGAGIGGLTAGAMLAPSTLAKSTGDVVEAAQTVAEKVKESLPTASTRDTDAYNTAVKTGDVTPLVNKPNPLQNDWVGATEAIIENASLEGKTDEDVKAALGKVDKEIVSKLEASIKSFSLNTEAKVDIYNKEIEKINAFLEQNPDSEKAKALLAKYTAARDAPIDPAKEAQANKFIGQLQTKLNEVVSLREGLAAREIESEANVLAAAKAIVTPASTTGTTDTTKPAVDVPTFIVRAMKLRGTKSPELVTAIESVISSGKATPEEIKTLRILADEVIASNKAKNVSKVSENVLFGSGEIKGISPTPGIDFKGVFGDRGYQTEFEKALSIGDKETANKEFEGLKAFVTAHGKKQEAYSQLKPNQMVLVDTKGEWEIKPIPKGWTLQQAVKEATSNGGFAWFGDKSNKGYTNTMANIDNEISIMVPVLQKMSLQIGKPINKEEVVSVKQTPKAKQASQEGQEVSGATAVNTGTKQASTGTSEAPTPPTVSKPKVSVPPEGTSIINNTGVSNGQGQKEKVLSTPPTEVGSGSTQQPTIASPTGQEAAVKQKLSKESKDALKKQKDLLKSLKIENREENKIIRKKIGGSLYSVLRGVFNKKTFNDVIPYDSLGSTPIAYRGLTSKSGGDIDVLLVDGVLDPWLRTAHDSPRFDEQEAKEYIYERIRDKNYLTEDSLLQLEIIGVRKEEIEALLSDEVLNEEIKRAEKELAAIAEQAKNTSTTTTSKPITGNTGNTGASKTGQPENVRYEPTNVDYSGLARVGTLLDNSQGSKRENEDGSVSYIFDSLSITLKQGNISVLDMRNSIALIDGTVKPKEFSNWEATLKEVENISKVELTPQQELINESQKELLEEKAASTPEATAEGESQESTDDTTGDGTSSSDNSDELNAGEEVIKEEARYTSKQEVLKAIKRKQQAFADFINCL